MSSVDYTDEFVQAAIDRLTDHLPEQIDEINARFDDFKLKAPRGYSDGTEDFTTYPWVEVFIGEDELSAFSLGNEDADAAFELGVLAHIQDPILSGKRLHALLKRLAGGITNVLVNPAAFQGMQAKVVRVRRQWRLDPAAGVAEQVTSAAYLSFRVETGITLR